MKVFLKDDIHIEALNKLKAYAEIVDDWNRIYEVDAVIVRKIQLHRDLFQHADKLKVIGFHGSGINGIDLDEARKHKVDVFTVPGLNAESVAELNLALALDVSHMITWSAHEIKKGISMQDGLKRFVGHELYQKTAGIVGMGSVGTLTAKKLKDAFHMKVLGYSRHFDKTAAARMGIESADHLQDILVKSDFVFLSLPYSSQTHHIIDAEELNMMKENAILINTARGRLVNEQALYQALQSHEICGAASDVFEEEPLNVENPLMTLDNFVPTPHIGGNTEEALYRVGMGVVDGILNRLQEKQL